MRLGTAWLPLVALLVASGEARAASTITTLGSWSRTVTASDLQAGAGSDLEPSYESDSDQTELSISGTASSSSGWRVDVRRSDTHWHGSLDLEIRRTSSGVDDPGQAGTSGVSGGTAYLAVDDVDTQLITGTGNLGQIRHQWRITGASVQVPPDTYSTTVVFTVVDQ